MESKQPDSRSNYEEKDKLDIDGSSFSEDANRPEKLSGAIFINMFFYLF